MIILLLKKACIGMLISYSTLHHNITNNWFYYYLFDCFLQAAYHCIMGNHANSGKKTLTALSEYFRFIVPVLCVECVHYNWAISATGYNFVLFSKCCDVTNFVRYVFSFFPFSCVVQSAVHPKRDKLKSHCKENLMKNIRAKENQSVFYYSSICKCTFLCFSHDVIVNIKEIKSS